uniref:Nudix (Nucleoside diphosphate linked moiety X)-type motif 8 n=1 Tax=Nothobranchius rachovii TaxID=451742 RepID=A0A1A8N9Q4_9TELE
MFKSPPVLMWACLSRLQLLLGESHPAAFSEHFGFGCQRAIRVKNRECQQTSSKSTSVIGTSSSTKTVRSSDQLSSCDSDSKTCQRIEVLHSDGCSRTLLLSRPPNPQVSYLTRTFWDRLIPQQWGRRWHVRWISLRCTSNNQFKFLQNHPSPRQSSFSPVGLLAPKPWILNWFCCKQAPSLPFNQIRAVHRASPHVADTWRDCLSLQNENRCRQHLLPHWQLYNMERVRRGASQTQGRNTGRWASILVSLCSVEGEPAFLFTLRSSTLKGRHKGDVSFAGGKSDPSDRDVVTTALRETLEELGITMQSEKVWGVMKPLRDASGMMIAPVLANLGPLEELTFRPNPEEVEEIFTLSLSHLCDPQNRGYTHFRSGDQFGYTLPVFCNGKHRVWGLTAVALDQALKLVVPLEHLSLT